MIVNPKKFQAVFGSRYSGIEDWTKKNLWKTAF